MEEVPLEEDTEEKVSVVFLEHICITLFINFL